MPAESSPRAARFSFSCICCCRAASSVKSLRRQIAPLIFSLPLRIGEMVTPRWRCSPDGVACSTCSRRKILPSVRHSATNRVSLEASPSASLYRRKPRPRMPSACSAAGFALEIIPVALTTSKPAGMLRVTSSLRRSAWAARFFSLRCGCDSSSLCAFRAPWKWRLTRYNTTSAIANNPPADPTPNGQRFGGLVVCSAASIMSGFISHKELRPPHHHFWTKIHHQQRGNSQERSERELVLAGDCPAQGVDAAKAATAGALGQFALPPHGVEHHNDGDAHQRSQQCAQQDCQKRSAHAEECSHHSHHLYVAHAHAFAPANPLIDCSHGPEKKAPERRAQQGVE